MSTVVFAESAPTFTISAYVPPGERLMPGVSVNPWKDEPRTCENKLGPSSPPPVTAKISAVNVSLLQLYPVRPPAPTEML